MQSIESARVNSDEAWAVIHQGESFTGRSHSNVALIGPSSILIFGGFVGKCRADGYVLEIEQNTVRKITNDKDSIIFICSNNAEQVVPGSFITVGWAMIGG